LLAACGGSPTDVPGSSSDALTTVYGDHAATSMTDGAGDIRTTLFTFDGTQRLGLSWTVDNRTLVWTSDVGATVTTSHPADLGMPALNELAHAIWEAEEQVRATDAAPVHPGLEPQGMQVCDGVAFTTDGCDEACGGEDNMYCFAGCMVEVLSAALEACSAQ
jgi:hypothetical protein